MKKELKLNQQGVQELRQEDLKKIDGGIPAFLLIGGILTAWAAINMLFN
ncbi:MAG: hypothetical protein ACK5M7_03085 [Draconibacterium sp.]